MSSVHKFIVLNEISFDYSKFKSLELKLNKDGTCELILSLDNSQFILNKLDGYNSGRIIKAVYDRFIQLSLDSHMNTLYRYECNKMFNYYLLKLANRLNKVKNYTELKKVLNEFTEDPFNFNVEENDIDINEAHKYINDVEQNIMDDILFEIMESEFSDFFDIIKGE